MTGRKRSERRRLNSIVSVRFTPDEVDELRRRARRLGLTMSGYLRHFAFRDTIPLSNNTGNSITTTVAGPVIVHYLDDEVAS